MAGLSPSLGLAIAHFLPPGLSFNRDGGESAFRGLMFPELGKQGVSVFLTLHGPQRGGELTRCYLVDLAPWIAGKFHRQGTLWKSPAASSNDAGFLEAEIAISLWCRGANDHVIQQIDLQNSAAFVDPAGEPQIGFRRGGVARWVVVLCGARCYVQRPGKVP